MESKAELLKRFAIDRSEQRNKAPRGRRAALLVVLLIACLSGLIAGGWWLLRESTAEELRPEVQQENLGATVDPSKADAAAARSALTASGYITATRAATVSSKTFGLITEVLVFEGKSVEQGEVLARVDDSLARMDLQLMEAEAQRLQYTVQNLQLDLAEAEREMNRLQALHQKKLTNEADLISAQSRHQGLELKVSSARVDLRIAEIRAQRQRQVVDDFIIRAPFKGIVTTKNAQPGEIIAPSSAGGGYTRTGICTIVDMTSLEIVVDVNETLIGRVRPGQLVDAQLYAYEEWTFEGKVETVVPSADRSKATFRVRIAIMERDERILPDMAVKVSFLNLD